jgi:tetratricopeptide (TPR) repeat protein
LLLAVLCPALSRAEIPTTAFESANKLYEEGKFAEAASAYAGLLRSNQASAALYFNLGNAFFKSGQIGRAIAAYRQAAQITPRDPDVRANLQFARNQTQGPTLLPNRWQRWLGRLTLNEWTLLAAGAVWLWFLLLAVLQITAVRPFKVGAWLWFLLLAVLQWFPTLRLALRSCVLPLAIAAGLLCGCLAADLYATRLTRTAIVITGEALVRHGPLAESQAAFTAHDGAELRVLDQKDEWLEVSAGAGRIGWLRRDEVVLPK